MTAVQTPNVIAALPPWAAALVWILAIGGAIVFRVPPHRRGSKSTPAPEEDAVDDAGSTEADAPPGVPSAFFVDPTTQRPGIPLSSTPADPEPPATPAATDVVADLTEPATTTAPPAEPATSGAGRAGYFAAGGRPRPPIR